MKGCQDSSSTNLVGSKTTPPNPWQESPHWLEAASIGDHSVYDARSALIKGKDPCSLRAGLLQTQMFCCFNKIVFCFHFGHRSLILRCLGAKSLDTTLSLAKTVNLSLHIPPILYNLFLSLSSPLSLKSLTGSVSLENSENTFSMNNPKVKLEKNSIHGSIKKKKINFRNKYNRWSSKIVFENYRMLLR